MKLLKLFWIPFSCPMGILDRESRDSLSQNRAGNNRLIHLFYRYLLRVEIMANSLNFWSKIEILVKN